MVEFLMVQVNEKMIITTCYIVMVVITLPNDLDQL